MRRTLAITGLVLTTALGLCACGGGGGEQTASTAPSGTATTAAGSIIDGSPLVVTPTPTTTDGTTVEVADGVSITVPSPLGDFKDYGPDRVKAVYYTSADDLGMIDVDTSDFDYSTVNLQARSEWQAYSRDNADPSELVQIVWPGAVDAYAFTWTQEADASVLDPARSGVVQVDGVALLLRTESGQDVYLAAYAASGHLEGSAALAALDSVTVTR